MMNSKFFFSLTLVAFVSLFASCKKDKTAAEIITDGSCWKNTKVEYQEVGQTTWENEPVEACSVDDCWDFNDNNVLVVNDGAVKCDPTDPNSVTGSWSLSSDEKTITLTLDGDAFGATLQEISESKMVIVIDFLGDKSRVTFEK